MRVRSPPDSDPILRSRAVPVKPTSASAASTRDSSVQSAASKSPALPSPDKIRWRTAMPFGDTESTCERRILRPILSEDGDGAHPLDGAGSRFGHAGDDADKGGFARTSSPDRDSRSRPRGSDR